MYSSRKKVYVIAVDFDGTIVEDMYPDIGSERIGATDCLRKLLADGHQLILWTVRRGKKLQEAVDWCEERGVTFYAVNKNYPEEEYPSPDVPRKLRDVDFFIDDRALGGLPPWNAIYGIISQNNGKDVPFYDVLPLTDAEHGKMKLRYQKKEKKRFRLFGSRKEKSRQ